jgi:hypothetical protein
MCVEGFACSLRLNQQDVEKWADLQHCQRNPQRRTPQQSLGLARLRLAGQVRSSKLLAVLLHKAKWCATC